MFRLFRIRKCNHEYEKITETITEYVSTDKISTTRTTYRCIHCNDTFKVIEDTKVAMSRLDSILKRLGNQLDSDKKKRRTINTADLKVLKNPLKTGCPTKNK